MSTAKAQRGRPDLSHGKGRARLQMVDTIAGAADLFASTLRDGQKILLFGNGESAADAQHIASFGDPTRSRD